MSANLPRSGPPDRVCITTAYEVRYWADKFDVSTDELKAVMNRVGNSLIAVEQEAGR